MAGQRLTDKTAMTTTPATGDLLMVVDVNDTTGSAEGTSKKIDNKFFMQTDKISISNAEYKALATTGKTLVSSPGAGFAIIPISVALINTEGGTPNTATAWPRVGHIDQSTSYWDGARFFTDTSGGGVYLMSGGTPSNNGAVPDGQTIEDKGLYLWCSVAPSGTSTNTLVAYVSYRIIDIT